jgi:hypothetical protein
MTITITNTSLEFTKLGSFGTALGFGQNLVNSMDTSFYARARGGATNPDVQVRLALGSGWGLAKGARCGVGEGDRGPWLGARQRAVRPARPVASPTSPLPRRQIAKLVDANERNDMYWVGAGRRLRVWVPVGWGQGQRRTVGSAACAAAAAPAPGPGHAARPPLPPPPPPAAQVEYTVHKPALEEQPRHLLSTVALGFNGRYNRLITVGARAWWIRGGATREGGEGGCWRTAARL